MDPFTSPSRPKNFLKVAFPHLLVGIIGPFLLDFLSDSPFLDDLDQIVAGFDKATKPRFRNPQDAQFVKFGSTRDNDPTCDIKFGQLKIAGYDRNFDIYSSLNSLRYIFTD